jgi:hypothetical protein
MAGSEVQRRHPWPSAQPAWQDPPWRLTGRVLTAWFEVPFAVLEGAMSPDLLPQRTPTARIRLRFYDLAFEALGANDGQRLAPREGRFREAVIGFPARFGGLAGESSLFMWTDSDTYLMWAREGFGWPALRGEIELEGGFWSAAELEGSTATARLREPWGAASLLDVEVGARAEVGTPSGVWLTPRRTLRHDGSGDDRQLLAVRPVVREAGTRYTATGRVDFDFREPHPLAALRAAEAEVEAADGFELLVGADVEVL